MKKLFVVIAMLAAMNANAQWMQQYLGRDSIELFAIQFVNNETGFAVGGVSTFAHWGSVFLKTINGGNSWERIDMNLSLDHWLYALSFINENTGWVCGRNSNVRKTTDGGITWTSYMAATNTPNFNAIQFLNAQIGYVGGRYGMVAKSTNGGVNWTALDSAYTHIDVIHFFDANTGIMGDANSGIYRTTNGGANWSFKYQTDSLGRGYDYVNSSFINENTGYLIGTTYNTGILIKTTNKGIDWSIVRTTTNSMSGVYASNSSNIYIGGHMNYILHSSDEGKTWSNQDIPSTSLNIYSIYFPNSNSGFVCGINGVDGIIYKTTNGGVGVNNINTEVPSSFSLGQNYPNPFNSTSNLKFEIANLGNVKLVVYDIMGREVQTLVNERLKPGTYETSFDGSSLNSGVYFYKLMTDGFSETKRMLMIK